MILVDTCIWIEFLKAKEPVFSKLKRLLEDGSVLAFEPIFAELLQGARDNRERKIIMDYWENLPKADTEKILVRASLESSKNGWLSKGVGLIDAAIIIHCRDTKSSLWTVDRKLLSVADNKNLFD